MRRENGVLRGAHRHQKGEGGESAGEEWAAGVRPSLRRPPRDHRRRGCQKIRRGAPKKSSPWPIPRRPGLRPDGTVSHTQSSLPLVNLPYGWCTCGVMIDNRCARAKEREGSDEAKCVPGLRTSLLDPFDARWSASGRRAERRWGSGQPAASVHPAPGSRGAEAQR